MHEPMIWNRPTSIHNDMGLLFVPLSFIQSVEGPTRKRSHHDATSSAECTEMLDKTEVS